MKTIRKALVLLSLFALSYVIVSAATLPSAVLAVNETNETTTTVPTTTTTIPPDTTTTTSTTTTLPNATTTTSTTTTLPNATTTTSSTTTTSTTTTTPPDTTAPTVGSVSPTSVFQLKSVTFVATVFDNVAVTGCNMSVDGSAYQAAISNGVASVTLASGLAKGSYSVYFRCWDAAGNLGTGAAVTVKSEVSQLSAAITLDKKTYYPKDSFNPRVKVTDPTGKIVTDATVAGWLTSTTGSWNTSISFFYSTLCDCYKAWHYISESMPAGEYTLKVTAKASGYESVTAEEKFSLLKPTLNMKISADRSEYYAGDSIKLTITFVDNTGNYVEPDSVSGEMRSADTGELVSQIYPWMSSKGVYYYTYYITSAKYAEPTPAKAEPGEYVSQSMEGSYKFVVTARWKEQEASDSVVVTVGRRGLSADMSLEKNVLTLGDSLRGRIKVFDKNGNAVVDAKVELDLMDEKGSRYAFLTTKYKAGYYEIEEWKVSEWMAIGKYKLRVRIEKGEIVYIEKSVDIQKEKLTVRVFFDQSSYSPGSRIYIKVLVTYPNGSVVGNAYIGGEMFPLGPYEEPESTSSEATSAAEGGAGVTGGVAWIAGRVAEALSVLTGEPAQAASSVYIEKSAAESVRYEPKICKIYFHPEGPIYYKGSWIQKYYVDDSSIPTWCPTGKYGLKLTVSVPGYAETLVEEDFNVALAKLLMETGFKIGSSADNANLFIYAEVKDNTGAVVPYVNIMGYLHPLENVGCVKRVSFGYDDYIRRYSTSVNLNKYECPAGVYMLEIAASQTSYDTAKVEQSVLINYTEGYEYKVIVPPVVGTELPVCTEVSCGPDCFQKVCSVSKPVEQCYEEVVDKNCLTDCKSKASAVEESASMGTAAAFDLDSCVATCTRKVACLGSDVASVSNEDMMRKLEEIHKEVSETKGAVQTIIDMLSGLINMLKLLFSGAQFAQPSIVATTTPAAVGSLPGG